MNYNDASLIYQLLDFNKMNNHTLYAIYSMGDQVVKKVVLKHLNNIQRNKIFFGCENPFQRSFEMELADDFLVYPEHPDLIGNLYTDKELVINYMNNKNFNGNVLWSILFVTDKSIEKDVLNELSEEIIDKAIEASYFYDQVKHRLNTTKNNKIKILIRMLDIARNLRPLAVEFRKG